MVFGEDIKHVFVDESGTTVLPKEGKEEFYTITGIIVPNNNLERIRSKAREIKELHAGKGELKSSSIGNNQTRRKKILKDIAREEFPFYCLVIDKNRIHKDCGLRFRTSFYKYLHHLFFQRLGRVLTNLTITTDPYGSEEFMVGFEEYLKNKKTNLFQKIEVKKSVNDPVLQIADVIAGSIRRFYLERDPVEIVEILKYPSLPIEEWPPVGLKKIQEKEVDKDWDHFIKEFCVKQTRSFIEENISSKKEDVLVQVSTARFLLYCFFEDPDNYIYRDEVVRFLNDEGFKVKDSRDLTTNILSKLRENEVIIASGEKGIKIPNNLEEIFNWVERVKMQVIPYLGRLDRARKSMLLATNNKLDIILEGDFEKLYRLLSLYRN